jgi:hypothetical protein
MIFLPEPGRLNLHLKSEIPAAHGKFGIKSCSSYPDPRTVIAIIEKLTAHTEDKQKMNDGYRYPF